MRYQKLTKEKSETEDVFNEKVIDTGIKTLIERLENPNIELKLDSSFKKLFFSISNFMMAGKYHSPIEVLTGLLANYCANNGIEAQQQNEFHTKLIDLYASNSKIFSRC